MERLGFCYQIDRCLGCNACQVACKDYNHLRPGVYFRRVAVLETDTGKGQMVSHYSGSCNHCAEAACVKACPVAAMKYAKDSTVVHDEERCIGCGICKWACPYGAITLSATTGKAEKCQACPERRQAGAAPACVEACLTGCLKFGSLKELSPMEAVPLEASFLPDPALTRPAVLILKSREAGNGL